MSFFIGRSLYLRVQNYNKIMICTIFKVTSKVYFSIIKLVYELPLRRRGQGGGFY